MPKHKPFQINKKKQQGFLIKHNNTLGIPDTSCKIIWVFLAILALNSVGSANASSNELVCRDCVPPNTAAIASTVVRTMLL